MIEFPAHNRKIVVSYQNATPIDILVVTFYDISWTDLGEIRLKEIKKMANTHAHPIRKSMGIFKDNVIG